MLACRNGAWEIAKKLGSSSLPNNNARPGRWRVKMVTPFGTFALMAFCMAVWQNLCGMVAPGRGLGDTHGLFSPKVASIRITDQSPLVARATVNRRISS